MNGERGGYVQVRRTVPRAAEPSRATGEAADPTRSHRAAVRESSSATTFRHSLQRLVIPGSPAPPVLQRARLKGVEDPRFEIRRYGVSAFEAYYNGAQVGSIEPYEDDDGLTWLNHVEVNPAMQRRGIGIALLEALIADAGGTIYASTAEKSEHEAEDDTRWLEPDGEALVYGAIALGLSVVLKHPFDAGMSGSEEEPQDRSSEEGQDVASDDDNPPLGPLPDLPDNFTSVVFYYFPVDEHFIVPAITLHAMDAEPIEHRFPTYRTIDSLDDLRGMLADHYSIAADRVRDSELHSLPPWASSDML